MDSSTTQDCDGDGWAGEAAPRLSWRSAAQLITSAAAILWAAVTLLAVTLIT